MSEKIRTVLLLLCGTILYFFVNFQRNAIPGPIFNELQSTLHVQASAITALGAMFMYIYAVCQLFSGFFADRYGGMRTICVGGLVFCIGQFLVPLSGSMPMLYASRALTGMGASIFYISMIRELTRAFPKNFPLIFSLMLIVGFSGAVAANAPFIRCVESFGWRNSLLVCAAVSLVLWLLFTILRFTIPQPPIHPVPFSPRPFWNFAKEKRNWKFCCFTGLNFGLFYVIQTVFGKKFLEDFCNFPSLKAGWVFSMICVLCAFAGLIHACIGKMFHYRWRPIVRGVAVVTALSFILLFAAVLFQFRSPWLAGLFFVLAVSGNISPITVSVLTGMNSKETQSIGLGISNSFAYVVVAGAGNLAGLMMDLFPPVKTGNLLIYTPASYTAVFGLFAALSLFALWAAFQTPEITVEK